MDAMFPVSQPKSTFEGLQGCCGHRNSTKRREGWRPGPPGSPAVALALRRLVSVQEVRRGGCREEPTNPIATKLLEVAFLVMEGERRVSVISVG